MNAVQGFPNRRKSLLQGHRLYESFFCSRAGLCRLLSSSRGCGPLPSVLSKPVCRRATVQYQQGSSAKKGKAMSLPMPNLLCCFPVFVCPEDIWMRRNRCFLYVQDERIYRSDCLSVLSPRFRYRVARGGRLLSANRLLYVHGYLQIFQGQFHPLCPVLH